jgi:predicted transcriptional regulator
MTQIDTEIDSKTVCVLLIEKIGTAGMKAIVHLSKFGESNRRQIILKSSMGTSSTKGVLLQLCRIGLLADKEGRGNETIYFLTEKGKRVAEHINMIEEILSEGT